jgi:hypothetical protein
MAFGWYRYSQNETEDFEQPEAPEEQPENLELENSSMLEPETSDDVAEQTFLDNTDPQPTDEQVSQVITEGALDASNTFARLIGSLNLDTLQQLAGESVAQGFLSSVIDETLQKVEQQLLAV